MVVLVAVLFLWAWAATWVAIANARSARRLAAARQTVPAGLRAGYRPLPSVSGGPNTAVVVTGIQWQDDAA